MKILQINSATAFGGGERHLVDLCRGLQDHGHEVFVAVRPKNRWQDSLDFLPTENLIRVPLRNSLDVFSGRQIASFVRDKQIDIIHAHVARDYPIAGVASRLSNTRLILTRHLTHALSQTHRLTFKQAGRIIAVSRGVANSLRRLGSPEKISVIHNGVDTDALRKIKSPGNSVIATIGELREHKGQADFIRAAAIVAEKYPSAKFLIIGKDNSENQAYQLYLENLVDELNVKNQIIFTGWLDNPTEIYGAFDIFVSSAHSEPFGLAIAESMASAKAVVATKTVGANELLTDNESGKLVEIGDIERIANAILEFLNDDKMTQQFGENARRRADELFSLKRMVSETESVYQSVM